MKKIIFIGLHIIIYVYYSAVKYNRANHNIKFSKPFIYLLYIILNKFKCKDRKIKQEFFDL